MGSAFSIWDFEICKRAGRNEEVDEEKERKRGKGENEEQEGQEGQEWGRRNRGLGGAGGTGGAGCAEEAVKQNGQMKQKMELSKLNARSKKQARGDNKKLRPDRRFAEH